MEIVWASCQFRDCTPALTTKSREHTKTILFLDHDASHGLRHRSHCPVLKSRSSTTLLLTARPFDRKPTPLPLLTSLDTRYMGVRVSYFEDGTDESALPTYSISLEVLITYLYISTE